MTDDPRNPIQQPVDPDQPRGLTIDWALYGRHLEDSDLSDDDKKAFIEALWSIMVSLVDLGFRINPLPEICGEVDPMAALAGKSVQDMVNFKNIAKSFNKVAVGQPLVCEEGGADGPSRNDT